ncbi:hypothetical protein [Pseudomonas sp. CCI3.1]|jgi:hypothetical protein|uniref:hypothetical protein n=1 Tax=Pseudomonas sp. CCI3.1 TaxID=3048618 RepID=UPI002AB5BF46|nr:MULTISPECIES: hypothetical protein [unclassified Pseudomonas]MDY7585025.1 hypothetical protein [Pseudomonas sp. CCI3.1]MEB0066070.1 hypothetical protein [Pseudomonas sp. CCI3.1]MEB0074734.1 hypothetical protein [Pseudomonas sp. CCI1.4]
MKDKPSAPKPKSEAPIRANKTISLRIDYNERLREEAFKNKTTASALIEKALAEMWGISQ